MPIVIQSVAKNLPAAGLPLFNPRSPRERRKTPLLLGGAGGATKLKLYPPLAEASPPLQSLPKYKAYPSSFAFAIQPQIFNFQPSTSNFNILTHGIVGIYVYFYPQAFQNIRIAVSRPMYVLYLKLLSYQESKILQAPDFPIWSGITPTGESVF